MGQALGCSAGANGAVQQRSAELVEKAPCDALTLHQPHGACIAVGQDRLGCIRATRCDGLQAGRDFGQRGVPADRRELPRPLGAAALERLQQALGMVGALGVA